MISSADRPRVVFDCNVLVQAISNDTGPSGQALGLLERNFIEVYLSRPVLKKVRAVLHYPLVRKKLPGLEDERIDSFLGQLAFRATLVRRVPHVFRLSARPAGRSVYRPCRCGQGQLPRQPGQRPPLPGHRSLLACQAIPPAIPAPPRAQPRLLSGSNHPESRAADLNTPGIPSPFYYLEFGLDSSFGLRVSDLGNLETALKTPTSRYTVPCPNAEMYPW